MLSLLAFLGDGGLLWDRNHALVIERLPKQELVLRTPSL